jgi:hypothetical protein
MNEHIKEAEFWLGPSSIATGEEKTLASIAHSLIALTEILESMAGPFCGHGYRLWTCEFCKCVPTYPNVG